MQRYTIIQPVCKSRTNDQEFLEKTRNATTLGRRAVLRDKHWCNRRHATDSKTCNDATAIDLPDSMMSGNLNSCADHEDAAEKHQGKSTTDLLVDKGGGDRTEETTGGEKGYDIRTSTC